MFFIFDRSFIKSRDFFSFRLFYKFLFFFKFFFRSSEKILNTRISFFYKFLKFFFFRGFYVSKTFKLLFFGKKEGIKFLNSKNLKVRFIGFENNFNKVLKKESSVFLKKLDKFSRKKDLLGVFYKRITFFSFLDTFKFSHFNWFGTFSFNSFFIKFFYRKLLIFKELRFVNFFNFYISFFKFSNFIFFFLKNFILLNFFKFYFFKSNRVFFFRRFNKLGKSRLFFFFFFRKKKFSFSFFKRFDRLSDPLVNLNFFGDKKWNFGFSENFRSFFLFFIISLFSKKILEKPFSINILTLKPFISLENRDWERRSFQKRFLRRF